MKRPTGSVHFAFSRDSWSLGRASRVESVPPSWTGAVRGSPPCSRGGAAPLCSAGADSLPHRPASSTCEAL